MARRPTRVRSPPYRPAELDNAPGVVRRGRVDARATLPAQEQVPQRRRAFRRLRPGQLTMQARVAWLEELEAGLPGLSAPRTRRKRHGERQPKRSPESADEAQVASVRGEDPNSGSARPAKHRDDRG